MKDKNKIVTVISLLTCVIVFFGARFLLKPAHDASSAPSEYVEYDNGIVQEIFLDSCTEDPISENSYRGEQMLLVTVLTGQYAAETLQVYNYVGPIYGIPLAKGDACTLAISTYADGTHRATVYEYDRSKPLYIILGLFILATIVIGGMTGMKSLLGLFITVASIFYLLFPALLKGMPVIPSVFFMCVYVAMFSFILLGGVRKKTICAWLGTVAGMGFALLFSELCQYLLRIDGYRLSDVEALLQMRQTGTPIGIKGLLSAGVIISSLGAVMDVAMSLSSALQEIHEANPALSRRRLFISGMNVGRDMVGTMTNTLILAYLGSGLVLTLYLYTLGLDIHQLLSSAYLSTEATSSLAASIGIILSVPLTTLIASMFFAPK